MASLTGLAIGSGIARGINDIMAEALQLLMQKYFLKQRQQFQASEAEKERQFQQSKFEDLKQRWILSNALRDTVNYLSVWDEIITKYPEVAGAKEFKRPDFKSTLDKFKKYYETGKTFYIEQLGLNPDLLMKISQIEAQRQRSKISMRLNDTEMWALTETKKYLNDPELSKKVDNYVLRRKYFPTDPIPEDEAKVAPLYNLMLRQQATAGTMNPFIPKADQLLDAIVLAKGIYKKPLQQRMNEIKKIRDTLSSYGVIKEGETILGTTSWKPEELAKKYDINWAKTQFSSFLSNLPQLGFTGQQTEQTTQSQPLFPSEIQLTPQQRQQILQNIIKNK